MSKKIVGKKSFDNIALIDCTYDSMNFMQKHIDNYTRISILVKGSLKEEACGKEIYAQCGSIVTKPGDLPHKNVFGPDGCRIVSVLFKNNYLENLVGLDYWDWQWFHGATIANITFSFVQNISNITSEKDLFDPIIELLATLSLINKNSYPQSSPAWLEQVTDRIKDEFHLPLQTKNLAEWISVHPVYLARTFRKHYGFSIKDYLRQLRLQKAIQELSIGNKPLVHIALDAGFADQSHMTRELSKAYQMSPGFFRKWTSKVSFVQDH